MKSARRIAREQRKNKKEKKHFSFFKILIPIVLIVSLFLFVKVNTHVWNGKDKVSVTYREDNGDIGVTVLDPLLNEEITLIIPGDTQVEVSRNYGTLRIKNVWQLGINEKIGGSLLAETVTKDFLFPTFLWAGSHINLNSSNISGLLHFVFKPGKTNISFGDRANMALFSLKLQDLNRSEIDLGKSQFLVKKTLNDGEKGYVISGPVSQRLTVFFADNTIINQNIKVNIIDATGTSGEAENLGEILQVIGGKVVSVDKRSQVENIDCIVNGTNKDFVDKIAKLFSCKITESATNFDLNIEIGREFVKRF